MAATALAVAATIAACGGGGDDDTTSTSASAPATTPAPAQQTTTTEAPAAAEVASGWTLPNADLGNTRRVSGQIDSSNVDRLGVAWTVPIRGAGTFGNYATTPVVVDGVVYVQNLTSDVEAIDFRTGRVLWTKAYNSPNVGPDGVNVVDGTVYGATASNAFALSAKTGEQLWTRRLVRNGQEGIDMAPGVNEGTVYVSTVPGNARGFYSGQGQAILWAMDARTGATKWKWKEVPDDLWGNKRINSGGGQWEPPTFDANGDVYIDVANPAPFVGSSPNRPNPSRRTAFGGSRPGPNLYTDSVVKLDKTTGRMIWYHQLFPHDVYDWDLNNSPLLANVGGQEMVISAGKGGQAIANDTSDGRLLWRTAVGEHNGHDRDNIYGMKRQWDKLPDPNSTYKVLPGEFGGVESPYASDDDTVYMAIVDLPGIVRQQAETPDDATRGTGRVVALDMATGRIKWDHRFASSPYGATAVINDLVFTTTFDGRLFALDTSTGDVAFQARLPAGTNAPVAINDDTVITAGSFPGAAGQRAEIVAYRLGATGAERAPAAAGGGERRASAGGGGGGGAASIAAGRRVFSTNCASCHTLAAAGASANVGPNLDQLMPSMAEVQRQVINGGGGMPAFGGTLSRSEIDSVSTYVSSVAGRGGGGGGGGGNGGGAP
ncbi:PQQ-binding-like beta-propeller repeat protein [Conexibacter sp. CPCC 206217]|uniref:outer membrane protein assembly factor BamB family protein n=1 Tax=Conexibacter sp. CPCC 206217 TaxID=3064574 RepID=UPI00271B5161|nr:PQQ-binding-like beta-propeller repeat protein [Conexibacter sp. CPCC 206217]MDO8210594.1 PQQ-binding-like beta-propeller repeat protein [Conexibacter sp. CPCC 206217]